MPGLELDRKRLAAAASDPLLLATDAAEALVLEGVPFRDAHERVAAAVRTAASPRPSRLRVRRLDRGASARRSTPPENVSKPCDAAASGGVSTA